ncbi:MAG: Ig-like domain-containing protein, partial [Bacteroidota bacterium]
MLFVSILLSDCATPGNPDGGPRDEQPPQLDSLSSTPNYQTNFTKQRLEFTFDEWVKLNNPVKEVLVSPPFIKSLNLTIRKKTVRVEFPEDEELKENTTYTINFGDAIQDLTESNPVPDFRFVFSTGDEIDSLSINGSIKDAITGEPVPDVRVFLYYNQADSVVRTIKPYYFAKADKNGSFKIENLPAATFKAF